jgi:MoaA/NifB/PqqE/SkfB family radical SAM enzyme
MGEPTLHPSLPKFIFRAKEKGFQPILTTNGSLLKDKGDLLLENIPYKISISLHAPDANPTFADENYLRSCIDFAKSAADKGCIIALRLWNLGTDADNTNILNELHSKFSGDWVPIRGGASYRLAHLIFLEWGDYFDWPDMSATEIGVNDDIFCYALRDHMGVLVDGTCVPCCLDADGLLSLGNLFDSELEEILSSERAKKIYDGFTKRRACEELCRKCGFARRFSKK